MPLTANQAVLLSELSNTAPGHAGGLIRQWQANDPKPIAQHLLDGNATLLWAEVNSLTTGIELGLKTGQSIVPTQAVRSAIAEGAEFPAGMGGATLEKINFLLGGDVFDMTHAGSVGSMEQILEPFPSCQAQFLALQQADGSINAAMFGGALTLDDVQAIL